MPRQHARTTTHGNSTNLLSSVFSFVSREFDSFVSNATGRPLREDADDEDEDEYEYENEEGGEEDLPRASSSRTRLPAPGIKKRGEKVAADKRSRIREDTRDVEEVRPSALRTRSRSRCSIDSDDERSKRIKRVVPNPLTPRPVHRRPGAGGESEEELAGSDRSRTPPKPRSPGLRHKRSFTMPGALYDRTSSLEPSPEPDENRPRVVRFASEVTTSPSPRKQPETPQSSLHNQNAEAGPSSVRKATPHAQRVTRMSDTESSSEDEQGMPSSPTKRASRPRKNSFVQEAIRLRSAEKNPDVSLLLPRSPAVIWSSPTKGKGKEKEHDPPEVLNIEDSGEESHSDQHDDHSERADISVRTRVKGKERELYTARQQELEREDDEDRRRDKERIRALEEELRKLREELAKRPIAPLPYSIPPPPPPPPPPPRSTVVSRSQTDQQGATFADVRASLRHAGTPVEKPINPAYGGPSVRKGQPTINLDADRMTAFLTELKSHRLRRVVTSENESRSQPAIRAREVGDVGNKTEFAIRPREIEEVGNRSEFLPRPKRNFPVSLPKDKRRPNTTTSRQIAVTSELGIRVGEKRKHVESSHEATQESMPSKRRAVAAPPLSADSSGDSFTDLSISSTGRTRLPMCPVPANAMTNTVHGPLVRARAFSRAFSGPRAETEITTPSLSSDNEHENVSNESQEGQSPPTPPPEESVAVPGKATSSQTRADKYPNDDGANKVEVIDADMHRAETQQRRLRTSARNRESPHITESFSRRHPASPKLLDSPRRPRPPARPRVIREVHQVEEFDDEDVDPLSLTYTSADAPSYVQVDEEHEESYEQHSEQWETTVPKSPPIRLPMRPPPGTFKQPPKQKVNLPSRLPVRKIPQNKSAKGTRQGPSSTITSTSAPPALRRRESLDAELRRAEAQYEADIANEDAQLESGTLSGLGTRNRKRGFLAFGGAAGRPAIVDDGMLQDLENLETSDDEVAPPSTRVGWTSSMRRV